jgi:hypothetical protein
MKRFESQVAIITGGARGIGDDRYINGQAIEIDGGQNMS